MLYVAILLLVIGIFIIHSLLQHKFEDDKMPNKNDWTLPASETSIPAKVISNVKPPEGAANTVTIDVGRVLQNVLTHQMESSPNTIDNGEMDKGKNDGFSDDKNKSEVCEIHIGSTHFNLIFPSDDSTIVSVQNIYNGKPNRTCFFNVKTRRWKNNDSFFIERSPKQLLSFIDEQWKKRFGEIPGDSKKEKTPRKTMLVDSCEPLYLPPRLNLSDWPKETVKVLSSGDKNTEYDVSISQHTCSCEDFSKRRSSFLVGDIRRCCKHIVRAILNGPVKLAAPDGVKALFLEALYSGRGIPWDEIRMTKFGNDDVLIIKPSSGNWVTIIYKAKNSGESAGYRSFKFNGSRWMSDQSPPNARLIKKLILEWP